MDWPKLLGDLKGRGWTQNVLADRCGVAQSTISALAAGTTKSPTFALGTALIELHRSGESGEAVDAPPEPAKAEG